MPWSTSNRHARLPKDWHRRRAIARRNAGGRCQWTEDGQRCPALGTDCDHVDRHGTDDLTNLQWLCSAHHKAKTSAEAAVARLSPIRKPAHHPGLR